MSHMGRILTGVANLDRRLHNGRGHPLLGRGSVHASLISGGQELSTYPLYPYMKPQFVPLL